MKPPYSLACECFHFLLPVWGPTYLDRYLELALPSQLSRGNLGSVPPERALYHIVTKSSDYHKLQTAESFKRLKDTVPVKVDFIDQRIANQDRYASMSESYAVGLELGLAKETAFFFLTADSVWSDGSFAACLKHLAAGKRAVMCAGIMIWDNFSRNCLRSYRNSNEPVLSIPPRSLVKLMVDYMHPRSLSMFREHDNPVHAYYLSRTGEDGFLARCFHLHPLVVWPLNNMVESIFPTLDLKYVSEVCADYSLVHVVTDSDELCFVDISERDKYGSLSAKDYRAQVKWVDQHCTGHHLKYSLKTLFFHSGSAAGDAAVERRLQQLIHQIHLDVAAERLRREEVQKKHRNLPAPIENAANPWQSLRLFVKKWVPLVVPLFRLGKTLLRVLGETLWPHQRIKKNFRCLYLKSLTYLAAKGVQGDIVEVAAGDGFFSAILAESMFQTEYDKRLVVVDEWKEQSLSLKAFPFAKHLPFRGNLGDQILGALCNILPPANIQVCSILMETSEIAKLDLGRSIAFLQLNVFQVSFDALKNLLHAIFVKNLMCDGGILFFNCIAPSATDCRLSRVNASNLLAALPKGYNFKQFASTSNGFAWMVSRASLENDRLRPLLGLEQIACS